MVASVVTQSKAACVGLLALSTLASALAQTPPSDCSGVLRQIDTRAAALVGVSNSSCFNAREQAQLAERFVNERLSVWARRLNLEEWRISVILTRRDDLKANTLGGIRWDKGKKSAVIKVQDPADYRLPFVEMLDDMELTIVHELVHLELSSLPRSEASRSTEEHAVNGIAGALLKLDRQR